MARNGHQFSQVPSAQIPRSSFKRDFNVKSTFSSGYLVPIMVDEALPGDTFSVRMNAFARLATPIVPIMDNLYMDTHFFAVPIRLIWDNWQRFNGEQITPGASTDFLALRLILLLQDPSIGWNLIILMPWMTTLVFMELLLAIILKINLIS